MTELSNLQSSQGMISDYLKPRVKSFLDYEAVEGQKITPRSVLELLPGLGTGAAVRMGDESTSIGGKTLGYGIAALDVLPGAAPAKATLAGMKGIPAALGTIIPGIIKRGNLSYVKDPKGYKNFKKLEESGRLSRNELTSATGHYRDSLGNIKTQISDADSSITPAGISYMENWQPSKSVMNIDTGMNLGNFLKHDELYDDFPEFMSRVRVKFTPVPVDPISGRASNSIGHAGSTFNNKGVWKKGEIVIHREALEKHAQRMGMTAKDYLHAVVIHEANHLVQAEQFLPSGSNDAYFRKIKKPEEVARKQDALDRVNRVLDKSNLSAVEKSKHEVAKAKLEAHLEFVGDISQSEVSSDYLYRSTLGELDAFWAERFRKEPNVARMLPVHEYSDRGYAGTSDLLNIDRSVTPITQANEGLVRFPDSKIPASGTRPVGEAFEHFPEMSPYKGDIKDTPFKMDTEIPNVEEPFEKPEYFSRKVFGTKKGKKVSVEEMSVDEYFDKVAAEWAKNDDPIVRGITGKQLQDLIGRDPSVKQYTKNMQDGDKFPMPHLDYVGQSGDLYKIFNQEGLHRSLAAKRAGYDRIPVKVVSRLPRKAAKRGRK